MRLKKIRENYKKSLSIINKLNKRIITLSKRNYRQKIRHTAIIQKKDKEIEKLNCRIEVTESMIKTMYKCSTSTNKEHLKNIALNESQRHNILSKKFVAKCLGVSRIRKYKKIGQRKSENISGEISKFYIRDDISRMTAGKKECRTKRKEKQQIRYLTDTIRNLYKIYKLEGGLHSFTTFFKYKPFYIISPTVASRDTYLCIKHSNMNYLLNAMISKKLTDRNTTLKDILLRITCDMASIDCMHGTCSQCVNLTVEFNVDENKLNEQVHWWSWQSEKHFYTKKDKDNNFDYATWSYTESGHGNFSYVICVMCVNFS